MKKEIFIFALVGLCAAASVGVSNAQTSSVATSTAGNRGAMQQASSTPAAPSTTATSVAPISTQGNATATAARAKLKPDAGPVSAESYKSSVANAVKKLLEAADRQGGIGEQVRAIARAQNDAAASSSKNIDKVSARGAFKTFLIGSDYKTLGDLRSDSVQTTNRIDQLTRLADSIATSSDKTEILNQIEVLKTEKTKIEAFVKGQESKFSLFGWFVKMFQ